MRTSRTYRLAGLAAVALLCLLAYGVPSRADEAAAKPKRIIHGKPENRAAVEALLEESEGDAEVEMGLRGGRVKELRGKFKIEKDKPAEDASLDFIDRHSNLFGLKDPKRELKLKDSKKGLAGNLHIHYQQEYNGVPIWGSLIGVHLDKEGNISTIDSGNVATPDIDTTPLITKDEALDIVIKKLDSFPKAEGKAIISTLTPPEIILLIYYDQLAYRVIIGTEKPYGAWSFFVNAKDGSLIGYSDDMLY